jgi:N-acetylmuramate 1-kinase
VQMYATPRLAVAHFDLYRLAGADDLVEIGFHDALANALVLVEWPERAEAELGADRLEMVFAAGPSADQRTLTITAFGSWAPRLQRLRQLRAFLDAAPSVDDTRRLVYLQGDASTRAYARLTGAGPPLVVMDAPAMPDGPPVRNGLSYSRIAHLAESVVPFVAIGMALGRTGLSAPRIVTADLEAGFVLLEDLGDRTFAHALQEGHDQRQMWLAAVDTLVALRRTPLPPRMPLPDGTTFSLPRFDRAALDIEIELILDWYWPAVKGGAAPARVRQEFVDLWSPIFDTMLAEPAGVFLRDVHSPNLFWLPDRPGPASVGLIDFQDALAEPWPYDLAALLQDARVNVSAELEREGVARYCRAVGAICPDFDRDRFQALYAFFGAQRNTRLVGLWVRLLKRDGKPQYLQHMPRTWDYLARNLAHPELAALRAWYDHHFPPAERTTLALAT